MAQAGWTPVADTSTTSTSPSGWTPVPGAAAALPSPPDPSQFESPETARATQLVGAKDAMTPSPSTTRMLAGAVGAMLVPEVELPAGMAVASGALPRLASWAMRGAPKILGAALGGGAAGAAQGGNIPEAAAEQAGYEAGGQALSWPLKSIARRAITPTVRKAAEDAFHAVASKAQGAVDAAKAAWTGLPQDVAPSAAGQMAHAAIQGPAKASLDRLGQAVNTAAKSGPAIAMTPIKEKVAALAHQIQPVSSHTASPDELYATLFGGGGAHLGAAEKARAVDAVTAANPDLVANMTTVESTHPLPKVLQAIADAPDHVSFEDAHKYKRLLDDSVNWQSPAKKQLQQVTKATRQTLRDALAVHEPYNQATAAYGDTVKLFTKGVAPQITKSALDNPEAIVRQIKGNEPTKLQMLQDLLLHQAAVGGDAEGGQAAWDAVRSAWTYDHLIKGGVDGFATRLGKLDPQFVSTMYGDPAGQSVLQNLQEIHGAVQQAEGAAAAAGATSTAQQAVLGQSSLNTAPPSLTDAAMAAGHLAVAPHSPWAWRGAGRMLRGPKINELIQYAAYSPTRTQALVGAMTGPKPGMAIADLMRTWGLASGAGDEEGGGPSEPTAPPLAPVPSHTSSLGPPPATPGTATIGAAAPAPAAPAGPPAPAAPSVSVPDLIRGALSSGIQEMTTASGAPPSALDLITNVHQTVEGLRAHQRQGGVVPPAVAAVLGALDNTATPPPGLF